MRKRTSERNKDSVVDPWILEQLIPVVLSLTEPKNLELFKHMRVDKEGGLRKAVDFCHAAWESLGDFLKDRALNLHPNIEDYQFPQDDRLDKEFAMPTVV